MAKAVISTWDAKHGWFRVLAPYLAVVVGWLWLENAWLAIGGYHVLIVVLLWMSRGPDPSIDRSTDPSIDPSADRSTDSSTDPSTQCPPDRTSESFTSSFPERSSVRSSVRSEGGSLFSGGTTAQLLSLVGTLAGVSAVFVAFSDFIVVPTIPIPSWLAERGLGSSHVLFAVYYGLVHPFLEEAHYRPLRQAEGEPAWRRRALEVGFAGYHVLVVYGFLRMPFLVSTFVGLWCVMALWRWMDARTGGGRLPLAFHVVADLAVSSCVLRWMS